MNDHPIRDPDHQADVVKKASVIESVATSGKMTVEYDYKDGRWIAGRVSYTFPRALTGGRPSS